MRSAEGRWDCMTSLLRVALTTAADHPRAAARQLRPAGSCRRTVAQMARAGQSPSACRPMWHSDAADEHDGSRAPPFLAGGPASGSPGAPRRRASCSWSWPAWWRLAYIDDQSHRDRLAPGDTDRRFLHVAGGGLSVDAALASPSWRTRGFPAARTLTDRSTPRPDLGSRRPRPSSAPTSTWRSSARAPTAARAGPAGSRTTSRPAPGREPPAQAPLRPGRRPAARRQGCRRGAPHTARCIGDAQCRRPDGDALAHGSRAGRPPSSARSRGSRLPVAPGQHPGDDQARRAEGVRRPARAEAGGLHHRGPPRPRPALLRAPQAHAQLPDRGRPAGPRDAAGPRRRPVEADEPVVVRAQLGLGGQARGQDHPAGPVDPIKARWMAFNGGAGTRHRSQRAQLDRPRRLARLRADADPRRHLAVRAYAGGHARVRRRGQPHRRQARTGSRSSAAASGASRGAVAADRPDSTSTSTSARERSARWAPASRSAPTRACRMPGPRRGAGTAGGPPAGLASAPLGRRTHAAARRPGRHRHRRLRLPTLPDAPRRPARRARRRATARAPASLLCGLAPTAGALVLFRGRAGRRGGAAWCRGASPSSAAAFRREEQGRAMARGPACRA